MDALPAHPQKDSTRTLMRRLWREGVRRYRGRLGLIVLLTALMAGLTALYPLVISRAFNLFEARDQRILYQIPILVVVVTAAKAAAQYGQNVVVQNVVLLVIRDLQARMFAHLSRADLAQVEREAPAALAARFTTDATMIRDALTRAINGVRDGVTVVGLVGSMLYLDWVLSLIAAALYPLAAMPIQRLGKRIRRASGGMQERMGETAALLHRELRPGPHRPRLPAGGTPSTRAPTPPSRPLPRPAAHDPQPRPRRPAAGSPRRHRRRRSSSASPAGAPPLGDGGGIGTFTGFVTALLLASSPLRALGSLNAALQEGLAGLARVFAIIDEPATIREPPRRHPAPPRTRPGAVRGRRLRLPRRPHRACTASASTPRRA